MLEDYIPIIIAFITGVFGPIGVIYIKHLLSKKKTKPDMVKDTLRISEMVNIKIDQIKDDFDVDRVWITQFHNGGNFYPTGKSIAKFSIMYETVHTNVTSIQNNFHNIPVNLFSNSINQLLINDTIEIFDFKDETIATFGLKYVAETHNSKSSYLFALKTIDDKFIGCLGLDFTKRKKKLDQDAIINLKLKATSIASVLMNYLHD